MLGALLIVVLPPRGVLLGESDTLSNLLYLFIISGIVRAVMTWPSYELSELDRRGVPVVRGFENGFDVFAVLGF